MKTLKKVGFFILFIVAILATIGGPGYLFYYGQPLFAISVLLFAGYGWYFLGKKIKEVIHE